MPDGPSLSIPRSAALCPGRPIAAVIRLAPVGGRAPPCSASPAKLFTYWQRSLATLGYRHPAHPSHASRRDGRTVLTAPWRWSSHWAPVF